MFILSPKVLKKLNFPIHENVYKHLIPINVNDVELEVKPRSQQVRRKPVVVDPEPMLSDYLRPIKTFEYRLELNDDDFDLKTLLKPKSDNFRRTYEFYDRYLNPLSAPVKSHVNIEKSKNVRSRD